MKYPYHIGNNEWIVEIKGPDNSTRELHIVLKYDSLNQMGWDSKEDINIHSIMENDHVNLQNKPYLLPYNMESNFPH